MWMTPNLEFNLGFNCNDRLDNEGIAFENIRQILKI
jgi:hypothetical protein